MTRHPSPLYLQKTFSACFGIGLGPSGLVQACTSGRRISIVGPAGAPRPIRGHRQRVSPHEPRGADDGTRSTKSTRRRHEDHPHPVGRHPPGRRDRDGRPAGRPGGVQQRRRRRRRRRRGASRRARTASTTAPTLTLWTRAPLEKQAKLLVDAYNASPREPGRADRRPQRRLRRQGRRRRRLGRPARPVRRRHRLRAELGAAGPVPGPHRRRSTAWRSRTRSTRATSRPAPHDGKEHVLPFVLDLSMLFWNKDLFEEAGLDPEKAPGQPRRVRRGRQGGPGAEQARHLRHGDRPELRRLPGLHLVPVGLGRRRARS